MSTPATPSGTSTPNFQPAVSLGGTLASSPQPDEPFYPLRCDQFLTMCDGEMSEPRSLRDICIGAFLAGAIGIVSMMATLDWDTALKQGRHVVLWTSVLWVLTIATLLVAVVAHLFMYRTRTRSAYSRVVDTIKKHFKLSDDTESAGA